jgi:lipoprotein NlpD
MSRARLLGSVLALALAACAHTPPPEARVHVVQKGETPTAIARRHGVSVEALLALNGVDDPTKLRIGQRLVLPAREDDGDDGAAPPAEPSPAAAPGPTDTPAPSASPRSASPSPSPRPAPPLPVIPERPGRTSATPGPAAPAPALDDEAAQDAALARLLGGGGGADLDRVAPVASASPRPATGGGSTSGGARPTTGPSASPAPSPSPSAAAGARPSASASPTPRTKPGKGAPLPPIPPPPPPPDLAGLAAMRATFTRSPRAGKAPLIWPVEGVVVSLFGTREGQRHDGIDIGAPQGTAIWAAADGEVVFAGEQPGYGLLVIVQHADDLVTVYAHNVANLVAKGDKVKQGDPIAQVGQTGGTASPAVHFEVRVARAPTNPLARLPDD